MPLDPALAGLWLSGQITVEITPDGTFFLLGAPAPYVVSPDGTQLTFPGTSPLWQFSRIGAPAATLTGLWQRFESDGADTLREEWLIRTDGTYTFHWQRNGTFEDEGIGTYTATATDWTTRERRARILTGPADAITMVQFFGPSERGTYAVAPDGQSWAFSTATGSHLYTRAV